VLVVSGPKPQWQQTGNNENGTPLQNEHRCQTMQNTWPKKVRTPTAFPD
jgi:hypothetical protein